MNPDPWDFDAPQGAAWTLHIVPAHSLPARVQVRPFQALEAIL